MLHWVYGPKFDGAVPSLRWLLPGVVAVAATKIVDSGLQSVNKPQRASYAQIVGLVVTLTGLYLTLKTDGHQRGRADVDAVVHQQLFGRAVVPVAGEGRSPPSTRFHRGCSCATCRPPRRGWGISRQVKESRL